MNSPVVPSDFCSLTPTPGTEPCEAVKRVFFEQPSLLCEFLQWMLNADGSLSKVFTNLLLPAGSMIDFAGESAPEGWLICDGSAVSRSTYADLFAVIGTTFGVGDGNATFNLPDMRRRVSVGVDNGDGRFYRGKTGGEETHTLLFTEMAKHTHPVGAFDSGSYDDIGLILGAWTTFRSFASGDDRFRKVEGAGNSGSWMAKDEDVAIPADEGFITGPMIEDEDGTTDPHNNMQPFVAVTKIIKT